MDFTATNGDKLTVYTTRCDTLFGVTYMVISPEHPYLDGWEELDPELGCGVRLIGRRLPTSLILSGES